MNLKIVSDRNRELKFVLIKPLEVVQLWNVVVEVDGVGVGKGTTLRDVQAGDGPFHCNLNLLARDGVLQ